MIHYMTPKGVGDAWVGNELTVVARAGIPFVLHALARPAETFFLSREVRTLEQQTRVLYPVARGQLLVSLCLAPWLFGRRFFEALWNALTGPRESFVIRLKALWHLALACHWARGIRRPAVSSIHAQWVHAAGTVAMYGAWLLDVPFSFTGHATDLFRDRAALLDKIRRADFIACISSFHRDFYLQHGARPEQLTIVYCGIDTGQFCPVGRATQRGVPRILSSGRLVEKKGFAVLIEACGILVSRGHDFECVIAGSGELHGALLDRLRELGLEARVRLTGQPLKQEEIPDFMASGDLYCLACVRAADDDVDGLPQMLMEAMACGLPVISTRLVGIPDLVVDEASGLLVPPGDAEALADALERLLRDPMLAAKMAAAGRERVLDRFELEPCLEPLLARFRAMLRDA